MKRQQPGGLSTSRRFVESHIGPVCRAISHLSDLRKAEPELRIVLVPRVSTRWQKRDGHLEDDRRWCEEQLAGCTILKVFEEVGSGKLGKHRTVLEEAIKYAKKHKAVLVASSRDRFIRGKDFDGTNQSDDPEEEEYQALTEMAGGVKLATILKPWKRGRSLQIKRGQRARGNKGGRPRKKTSGEGNGKARKKKPGWRKRLTARKRPLVIASIKEGFSIRKTAAMHGVPESTARKWWTKHKTKKKVRTQRQ